MCAVMAIVRLIHIMFMYSYSYTTKIGIFSIVSVFAYVLLGLSILNSEYKYSFEVLILSCILHGAAHAFGESVLLGFFKFFPSDAVFYFASGTGFS